MSRPSSTDKHARIGNPNRPNVTIEDMNEATFYDENNITKHYDTYYQTSSNSEYYISFTNAYLYSDLEFVYNESMIYKPNLKRTRPLTQLKTSFIGIQSIGNTTVDLSKGVTIFVSQLYSDNWYHYAIQNYIRLSIIYNKLLEFTEQNNSPINILIGSDDKPSNFDANELFSILNCNNTIKNVNQNVNIIKFSTRKVYYINKLITIKSYFHRDSQDYYKSLANLVKFWRNEFYEHYVINKKKYLVELLHHKQQHNVIKILYQIRTPRSMRAIIDYDKLTNQIKQLINATNTLQNQYKFELETFSAIDKTDSNLSIAIEKHYLSDIVIAPHGAGITNMLLFSHLDFNNNNLMNRRKTLIEIHPKFYSPEYPYQDLYEKLSKFSGFEYYNIFADNGNCCSGPLSVKFDLVIEKLKFVIQKYLKSVQSQKI